MKIKKSLAFTIVLLLGVLLTGIEIKITYALSQEQLDNFSQNNILFYDPDNNSCVAAQKATGTSAIAQAGRNLAWGKGMRLWNNNNRFSGTQEAAYEASNTAYKAAAEKNNMTGMVSCVYYATLAVRESVDPDFPLKDSTAYDSYLSSSPDWKKIEANSVDDLKAGDFLIQGNGAHVLIYLGDGEIGESMQHDSNLTGYPSVVLDMYWGFGGDGITSVYRYVGDKGSNDSTGNMQIGLKSSPNYNSTNYQTKLSNLNRMNQLSGDFASVPMCENSGNGNMSWGCGLMSAYAAYYMFSSEGLGGSDSDNITKLKEFLDAAHSDGYNLCDQSDAKAFGSAMSSWMDTSAEMIGDRSWDGLVELLKSGKKLIVNTVNDTGGKKGIFAIEGHYVMLDHYNAEKDMIYVFDPSMREEKRGSLYNFYGSEGKDYEFYSEDIRDGLYVSRDLMENSIEPTSNSIALTYNGYYSDEVSNVCSSGSGKLVSGGMSYNEALNFIKQYQNEAAKKLTGYYGLGYANGITIGSGTVNDAGCAHGTLNNCSAFTQWFVNNYTTLGPNFGSTSGSRWVDELLIPAGFTDSRDSEGYSVPTVYSIFSTGTGDATTSSCFSSGKQFYNHTGVVLGINVEKDEVYLGEAHCADNYSPPEVRIVSPISSMKYKDKCGYRFADPGNKIKLGGT